MFCINVAGDNDGIALSVTSLPRELVFYLVVLWMPQPNWASLSEPALDFAGPTQKSFVDGISITCLRAKGIGTCEPY